MPSSIEMFQRPQITCAAGGSSSIAPVVTVRQKMVFEPFNFKSKKSRKKRIQTRHEAMEMNEGSNPHQATLKGGLHGRLNRVVAW